MNIKIIAVIVILITLFALLRLYIRRTQVWRRRFSEFPVRLFEIACGNEGVSGDGCKLNETIYKNTFTLIFTEQCQRPISLFIKSWLNGISLPSCVSKCRGKNTEYNLSFNVSNPIKYLGKNRDCYYLVLYGDIDMTVNSGTYSLTTGDIIFVPKDTEYGYLYKKDNNNIVLCINC